MPLTTPAPTDAPPAAISAPGPVGAPPGPPPSIVANRQRLDNRFPVLAFSIRTFGRPLFEVLLTTDRALFDPANAARRTPANFYAGRQDGGLARATAEDTAFVVPAAVLRRFADAAPRPGEIYFTVAAYATAEGGPVLAQSASILAMAAPSVLLGRDFTAHTLASVLSVPAHKLAPVNEPPAAAEYTPAMGLELDDDDIPAAEAQSWTSENAEEDEIAAAAAAWSDEPSALSLEAGEEPEEEAADIASAYAYADGDGDEDDAYGAAYAEDDADEYAAAYGEAEDEAGYGEAAAAGDDPHGASYADEDEDEQEETSQAYAEDPDEAGFAEAYDDGYQAPVQAYGADEDEGEESFAVDDGDAVAQAYDDHGYGHGADAEEADPEEEPLGGAAAFDGGALAADGYDDGYDAAAGWAESGAAANEPGMLADADDDVVDQELASGAASVGQGESYEALDGGYDPREHGHGNGHGNGVAAMAAPPFGMGSGSSRELDIRAQIGIVTKIGRLFEGREGFRAINADTEFGTPSLPQHGRWHVGLSYGLIGFTQDSGLLGRLLALMRERDADAFTRIFGGDATELLRVTNAPGPSSRETRGGRGPRVQPVAGADLWVEPWLSRFRRAAEHREFQAAQNQLAVVTFLTPMLRFAAGFGLDTERALAMVVDRAVHMGVGGARRWLTSAIAPVRTDAQRQQALSALRIADLRQLQQACGLRVDGSFGPLTHAALVGALRRLGPASPVPIPTREQLMDTIVARANGEKAWWRVRPTTIRSSAEFSDTPLVWAPAKP